MFNLLQTFEMCNCATLIIVRADGVGNLMDYCYQASYF